ncbi:MAG: ATP-binding protein [Actinomycetota bacterium]
MLAQTASPVAVTLLVCAALVVGLVIGALVATSRMRRRAAAAAELAAAAAVDVAPTDAAPTEVEEVSVATTWAGDPRIDRALGALPIGVVVTDTSGNAVYRNRFAQRFERGRHGDALVEAALHDVISAAIVGQSTEVPIDLYGPPARNLELRGSATYDGGALTGSVVLIEDVTSAHNLDRVRKDFVANVSHELRTPIGGIGVLAETLRDADDPEVIDRLSGRLQNEALRLGGMIDDLLTLSRLESGRIEDPELMDLHQVLTLAIERSSPTAEYRQIELVAGRSQSGPVFVDGDQRQMVSAVANLLDNAIKYSDPGSEVVADVYRTDRGAILTVTDTGIGIPEAAQTRIFERFYRVDDARSRVTGGTGLGLSIVRHVVLNHRGTIRVESTEGQGSAFTVSLPLSKVHQPAPHETMQASVSGSDPEPPKERTQWPNP